MLRLLRELKPLSDGFRILARLLPAVDRRRSVIVTASAALMAAAQVTIGVATGSLIARVVTHESVRGWTLILLLALPALLLLLESGRLIGATVGQTLKRKVDGELRRRVLALSLDPPGVAHLEDPELLAIYGAARNLSPFTFTPGDAAVQLSAALAVRLQPLFALGVLAWFEPWLAVISLLLWAIAQVLFIVITIRLVMGAASSMASPEVLYLRDLVQGSEAAKEVRVFGLAHWFSSRFRAITKERLAFSLAQREGHVRTYFRAGGVLGVGLAGGLLWIGLQRTNGSLSIGQTATCCFALLNTFFVPNLIPDVPVMFGVFAVEAVERAEAALRPGLAARTGALIPAPGASESIRFRQVSFTYPGSTRPVFSGLDLAIPAGQRLAVVGLNGAGKTTLVKLLCRLYDPDSGTVEIDGVPLPNVDPTQWRRHIGVLFQDFIRYRLPARDNVALRAEAAPPIDVDAGLQSLRDAATSAGVLEIVEELPSGWETPLHPSARGGVDLSGGQWQRVALARGLYAVQRGATVLVLDEPTANLDPRAELGFFDSVLNQPLGQGKPVTTILISHRFATVRHADRIVVLDEGRVVEDGTHDELIRQGGQYRALFESQAKAFAERSDV
jgi:ATP-binding cassette subfamily B protein